MVLDKNACKLKQVKKTTEKPQGLSDICVNKESQGKYDYEQKCMWKVGEFIIFLKEMNMKNTWNEMKEYM